MLEANLAIFISFLATSISSDDGFSPPIHTKSTSDCKTFIAQTTLEPITPGPVFPTPGPYVTSGPIEFQ